MTRKTGLCTRPRMLAGVILLALVLAAPFSALQPEAGAAVQAASQPGPYRANVKTMKFHHAGCEYYNCKNCVAVFRTRQEAISAGYAPCKVCKP